MVSSFVTSQSKVCIKFSGAPTFFNSMLIKTNKSIKTFEPAGDGETIIEFLVFSALIILFIGVAAGLVEGVTAATTPTGFAISIIPFLYLLLLYQQF